MKKFLLCLTVLILIASCALADTLPAPSSTGTYIGSEEVDGINYLVYEYEQTKTASSFVTYMSVYKWTAQRAGYTVEELEDLREGSVMGTQTYWYVATDGVGTAFICEQAGYFSTKCTVTFFVPEDMDFDPNPEQQKPNGGTYNFGDGASYTFDFTPYSFQNGSFFH